MLKERKAGSFIEYKLFFPSISSMKIAELLLNRLGYRHIL